LNATAIPDDINVYRNCVVVVRLDLHNFQGSCPPGLRSGVLSGSNPVGHIGVPSEGI
jgi:hypothetical protein